MGKYAKANLKVLKSLNPGDYVRVRTQTSSVEVVRQVLDVLYNSKGDPRSIESELVRVNSYGQQYRNAALSPDTVLKAPVFERLNRQDVEANLCPECVYPENQEFKPVLPPDPTAGKSPLAQLPLPADSPEGIIGALEDLHTQNETLLSLLGRIARATEETEAILRVEAARAAKLRVEDTTDTDQPGEPTDE